MAKKGERLPEGRKHKRDPLQTQGKGNAIGLGPGSPAAGNPSVGALASGTQAKGKRVAHEAPKLPGFPLPFCLSQLLLHDLRVPLLGDNTPRQLQCFPFTGGSAFLFFWRAAPAGHLSVMGTAATLPFCALAHLAF